MVSRETLPHWLEPAGADLLRFEALLADTGVTRGLIGPREVDRLWERHLLNCAVVADPSCGLLPPGCRVADVGSGAGLPGLVLLEAVEELGLMERVTVLRARAEDVARGADWAPVDVVTARAVAPLDRLLGWTVPLLAPGGRLVALKGASAEDELASAIGVAVAAGLTELHVVRCGVGVVDPATTVITGTLRTAQ